MPATEVQLETRSQVLANAPARRAADLVSRVPTMTPANTNEDVIDHFRQHPGQTCLPVLEDDVPIGLINRGIFLTGFAQPFRREIYNRKSCIAFMDKMPLVVEGDLALAELGRLAVEAGGKVLQDGFIVTTEGRFTGLGSGLDLLRALGELEAERNRIIRESIDYAQIIQNAVLQTSRSEMAGAGLPDCHLLWEPRDTVGGDAFFARRMTRNDRNGLFLALMDCTGHGVPGAFTAMLMTSILGHALDLAEPWEPGRVLAAVNALVKDTLGQRHRASEPVDSETGPSSADEGMDVTCLWIDQSGGEVVFSGARHSLWIFNPGTEEPAEVKGDRIGVGYVETPDDQVWSSQRLELKPGAVILATTDGILDQIGGPRRIAFGRRRLWEAFARCRGQVALRHTLEGCQAAMVHYQGAEIRRDDVSMLAIRI